MPVNLAIRRLDRNMQILNARDDHPQVREIRRLGLDLDEGFVLRIGADGRGFVLLDSPYQEIRKLRFDDKGVLFVAAANGRANSGSAPQTPTDAPAQTPSGGASGGAPVPTVSVSTEITAVVVDSPSTGAASAPARQSPSGLPCRTG